MSIHELPQAAVRSIGSSQILTDPESVVKELIDNAIDARAFSVFVEISANALDVIQVRDTGHGIAPNDRPLVARRYCTSKIRNEKDLTTIGGSYLGFRGEALSSAADMSAAITITTRIEGEDIATALNIASNGEISAQEPASHPIGTTVRVTDFLSKHPVRKQIALKCISKTIGKIKQILQTYAFARPTTRLSLRVMKAKSDRDDWTYAPKAGMDMEETAMKVVGKACTSQCAWYEVTSKGFQIYAFVPRSNAEAAKIGTTGQYLSVDGRPVSSSRGLFKQIVKSFKANLQKVVVEAALIKEPFMYMAIACPEGSYDPNIEPAKDDVLFEDADVVLAAVQNLLESAYPVVQQLQQSQHVPNCMEQYEREKAMHTPVIDSKKLLNDQSSEQFTALKSNMYDMDEDDIQLITNMADEPVQKTSDEGEDLEEEPVTLTSSNPWIMAKMNGRTGKTNLGVPGRGQLITPVKESNIVSQALGSPTLPNPVTTVLHMRPALLTPRASSPIDCFPEDPALSANTRSVRSNNLLDPHPHVCPGQDPILNLFNEHHPQELCAPIIGSSPSGMPQQSRRHVARDESQHGIPLDEIPSVLQRRRGPPRKAQQQYVNNPCRPPRDPERDAWFDVTEARYSRRTRQQKPEQSAAEGPLNFSQPRFLSPPPNNRDIRSFIGAKRKRRNAAKSGLEHIDHAAVDIKANLAPINGHTRVPTLHSSTCDFVSASKLDLVDSTSPSLPLYRDRQPSRQPRRRRTGERTFVDVTSNSRAMADDDDNDKDPSREPRLQSTTSRRQRTKDGDAKPHRTKSSQLPLERVPPDLYMQNVVLSISTVEAQLELSLQAANANANGLLLRWNEPACDGLGLLDRMLDVDVDVWAERLSAALEMRFPSGEMVGDLKGMLKLASRRTDCMV